MTSRGTSPLTASDLVARPRRPARAAGDPGATATTRAGRHRGKDTGRPRARPLASAAMAVDRVLLAEPRGFCAGVEMAIKALAWMVRAFEPPVYCYHEIVHNQLVVDRFRDLGVVFVDDVDRGARRGARSCCRPTARRPRSSPRPGPTGGYVVDAVCPLVTKVHHEVKVRAGKGYRSSTSATRATRRRSARWRSRPTRSHRVESVDDVDALPELRRARSRCSRRPRCRHRDWAGVLDATAGPVPDAVDARAATTSASPPPTASPRSWRSRRAATPSS